MKKIISLKEIFGQYKYFLVDLNGIMWKKTEFEGRKKIDIFSHSFDTIKFLYENNKKVIFFSNLRQTSEQTREILITSGLKKEWVKNVVTSTQVLLDYVEKNKFGSKYSYIGPESNFTLIDGCYVCINNPSDCDFIITRGFEIKDEEGRNYMDKLKELANLGKPILFLNPDKEKKEFDVFNYSNLNFKSDNIVCFGKPYLEMYNYVFEKFGISNEKSIVAIGDKLATDVLGATNFGIDCVFIVNGELKEELYKEENCDICNTVLELCAVKKLPCPKYVIDNLFW